MRKRFKVMLRIILVLIILIAIILAVYFFLPKNNEMVYKEIDKIDTYGYV